MTTTRPDIAHRQAQDGAASVIAEQHGAKRPADVLAALAPWRERFEHALSFSVRALTDTHGEKTPPRLVEAMEHALLAPGKRIRPMLVLAAGEASLRARGMPYDDDILFEMCLPACLALEHIHAYSLVHDDLPGIDNDDVRRGRPTVHVAFDEATAILAGDGLLTNAFALLSDARHHTAAQVKELARAAGSAGMVGGQHDDTRSTPARSVAEVESIHARKTGCLFRAALRLGALSVNDVERAPALGRFGELLGLAFQIGDDVLDVEADPTRAGKRLGRDAEKVTYVTLLGLQGAKHRAQTVADEAVAALAGLEAPRLVSLVRFAAARDH